MLKEGGHVYHLECLSRWLSESRTCPTCRKKTSAPIVLFLDTPASHQDSRADACTTETLQRDIAVQKARVRELEAQIKKLNSHIKELTGELQESRQQNNIIKDRLNNECSANSGLKKQLRFLGQQEVELARAKKELLECTTELAQLKRVQVLVKGHSGEVEEMLTKLGGSDRNSSELVTQLVILKRELEKLRSSKNRARELQEKCQIDLNKARHEVGSRDIEISKLHEALTQTEADLTKSEQENASLKKKLGVLQSALSSSSPRSAIINRFMMESPAPMELKWPRLSPPEGIENLERSEAATTPRSRDPLEEDPEMQCLAKELGLKNLKTTTLTQNQARPLKPRNARKRPAESTSCFRTGYDGMGGHTKFLLPSRPSKVSNKKVSRPNTISKFIKQGTTRGREPPLPVMTLD